jgi:predicted GNAT family acetyltransferase
VVEEDGVVAELVYRMEPGILIVVHTGVPDAISGRGVGGELVRAAVLRAAVEQRTVVPWCPYARTWLREHPDEAGTVTIDWASRPRLS